MAFMSTPLVPPALSAAGREMAREEAATLMIVDLLWPVHRCGSVTARASSEVKLPNCAVVS
jgi:hypothetical protein